MRQLHNSSDMNIFVIGNQANFRLIMNIVIVHQAPSNLIILVNFGTATLEVSPVNRVFLHHTLTSVTTIPVSVFVVIGLSIAIQLGMNPTWLFFECFITMFIFYAAHWQTYCTGTLKFGRWVLCLSGSCLLRDI